MDIRQRQLSGNKSTEEEESTEEDGRSEKVMEEGEIADEGGHDHHHHRDIMDERGEEEEEKEKRRKMDDDEMMETDSPEGQEDNKSANQFDATMNIAQIQSTSTMESTDHATENHRELVTSSSISNAVDVSNSVRDDANLFQAFFRMALAAFMTLWVVSRALFIEPRPLPEANSQQIEEDNMEMSEKEEESHDKMKSKKKAKKSESSSSSSSSDSSAASSDREEEEEEKEGKKKAEDLDGKGRMRIDSQLLHTDTMPVPIQATTMDTRERSSELEEQQGEEKSPTHSSDVPMPMPPSAQSPPESPPIIVETIGVRQDHLLEQMGESPGEHFPFGGRVSGHSPFIFFPMGQRMGPEMEEEGEGDEAEEEEESPEGPIPTFGRLDAIVEEDSDELRSAQSSRASTARARSSQQKQSKMAEMEEKEEKPPHPPNINPFQFLFQRQQSGSSQSSVAKVTELSTPEAEEEKILAKAEEFRNVPEMSGIKRGIDPFELAAASADEEGPKVPRLDLAGVSPDGESEEATAHGEGEDESIVSASPSETETVLVVEEANGGEQQISEEEAIVEEKRLPKIVVKEEEKVKEETTPKKPMFPSLHHPADADRDQGEVFVDSMADQQIPMPTLMEEGHLSSPSMSINLDRSRDSLDHSVCSNPTRDENLTAAAPLASAATAGVAIGTTTMPPAAQHSPMAASPGEKARRRNGNVAGEGEATVAGISGGRKQSEKASSTSSSAFGAEEPEDEDEDQMPLPPPPPPPPPPAKLSAISSEQSTAQAAMSPPKEKAPPPPPPSAQNAQAKTTYVTPLWGRNERLVSYLHGYGGQIGPKDGEGKENGQIGGGGGMRRASAGDGLLANGQKKWATTKTMDDAGWTVHPIALKERPPRSPMMAGERQIPVQHEPGAKIGNEFWRNGSRPHYQSPTSLMMAGSRGQFERDIWAPATKMSSSELPPLPPLHPQQPPPLLPLYVGSSGKPSPSLGGGTFDQQSFRADSQLSSRAGDHPPHEYFMQSGQHSTAYSSHQPRTSTHQAAGIRDIPIQRSASAFAPSIGGGGMATAPLSSRPNGVGHYGGSSAAGPGHEYYRREVLTRTLVTRSTEALSAPPPLSRSSPIGVIGAPPPPPPLPPLDIGPPPSAATVPRGGDEVTEEYWIRYSRNIEEEERRIRMDQERRRREEEERRRRIDEQRRRWEQQEVEVLERMRREREKLEKELEAQMLDKIRGERDRIAADRQDREAAERRRREEWERIERERRAYEEAELEKRREMERLERERLERERLEAERREREQLEALRREQERLEAERLEQERIERERIEIERLEIERIERIKREQREKEAQERERQRQEAERLQKEREELERLEKERLEIERQAKELLERERMEEAERERQRDRERREEAKRREEEQLARERLERAEREAMERELARRAREKAEQDRLDALRREQERLAHEELEAERRERERMEEERRERELVEAAIRARERREQERRDEEDRERKRQEEERLEYERRQRERIEAQQRERDRQIQEQQERDRLAHLEAAAAERRAQRAMEEQRQRERADLERRTEEMKEIERREQERRERERERLRAEEERRLAELRDLEQRNAELRDRERREAAEREERRRREGWRSRELLEQLARERDEKAQWETEKRRLLAEREAQERKRQALTSKETLERLTRKPYYSKENLTSGGGGPDVTTKVERQVIERVDRTLWTDTDLRPASSGYGGTTTGYGGGGGTNGGTGGYLPSLLLDSVGGDEPGARERLYQSRQGGGTEDPDWFRRGGSTRTSKYRQRMERARKEFLGNSAGTGGPSDPAPFSYDPITNRFRKSTDDLLAAIGGPRRVDYRGPLLQKFNSGEFSHPPEPILGYGGGGLTTGLGRSPYEQEFQRLLDKARRSLAHYYRLRRPPTYWSQSGLLAKDIIDGMDRWWPNDGGGGDDYHRSKSVLDASPGRPSRRDVTTHQEQILMESASHTRSKSADYLTDPRRPREEATIPENDLQKSLIGEHELRFRKSTERMHVPDWYRDYGGQMAGGGTTAGGPIGPPSATTSGVFSMTTGGCLSQPYNGSSSATGQPQRQYGYSPPSAVGGISFPAGMFDKYKDEIEDLRRSRTSLHQLGQQSTPEHTKEPPMMAETTVTREYSREAFSKTEVQQIHPDSAQQQPGYSVYTVPTAWKLAPKDRQNSRVVEVADTFVDRPMPADAPLAGRYGGRVTLEEALDALFQSSQPIPEPPPADPTNPERQPPLKNADGPGIFTPNQTLMNQLTEQPQMVEQLLKNEPIYIRCAHCHSTSGLAEARGRYCWCRHCYTYYCSRACRQRDWERHRDRCSFARINSLCKEVIMKVRRDPETQFHMSRVAREGFRREGRGSVNIRLISAYSAQLYLDQGWRVFAQHDPNQLLFYYPIQALIEQRKEPSLIQLCKKYNPNEKFILSVSIIADIEQCPETPPPVEPRNSVSAIIPTIASTAMGPPPVIYGTSVPTNV